MDLTNLGSLNQFCMDSAGLCASALGLKTSLLRRGRLCCHGAAGFIQVPSSRPRTARQFLGPTWHWDALGYDYAMIASIGTTP